MLPNAGVAAWATMFVGALIANLPFLRQVQMAAVVAGLVPNGLFFMVILAYAMGALRMAWRRHWLERFLQIDRFA